MKKFLVFALVLGISSMASALVSLDISVDGEIVTSSEITIGPSDEITLDIHGTVTNDDPVALYLILQGPGTMSGGTILQGDGVHVEMHPDDEVPEAGGITWGEAFDEYAGYPGVQPMINMIELLTFTPELDLEGVLFDGKIFHCLGPEDVTLTLVGAEGLFEGTGVVYDTLIIHQPEPMTIALLGLGGLFLRRRK